jgi:hypothetical protein
MPTIEQARTWYPTSDPVHGFDHVLRVYYMAERLALAEDADLEIVWRRRASCMTPMAAPPGGDAAAGTITRPPPNLPPRCCRPRDGRPNASPP